MRKKYKVYLKSSKRYININILEPRKFDNLKCLYLLDGQNAFKDKDTLYGRSLRINNIINYLSTLGINLLTIGIESDEFRNSEYSPFQIINTNNRDWLKSDIDYSHKFSDDVISSIVPFVDNMYGLNDDKENRIIYGSSLGAIEALYLGLNYNSFKYIGAFSTASFIYDNEFDDFILSTKNVDKKVFIYVGAMEESDREYTKDLYLKSATNLHLLLDKLGIKNKLVINKNGTHNEKSWSYYIPDFINYIYKQ